MSPELVTTYRAMASRSPVVQLVNDVDDCSAMITDCAESALSAVDAGRQVLVVSPFGRSAEICQRLSDSNCSMPAHTARFQPSIQQVKQALDAGKLGEAGLLRIHCWNANAGEQESLARELDLAIWIFGSLPGEVYAVERSGYLQVHLGFDRGGMALIDLDTVLPNDNEYYSLSLIGSTGAACSDDHHNMNLLMGNGGTTGLLTPQGDTALMAMINNFMIAVRDGGELSPNWSDTQATQQVAGRVHASAQNQNVFAGRGSHG